MDLSPRLERRQRYDEWREQEKGLMRCPWCDKVFMSFHPGQKAAVRRHPHGLGHPPTSSGTLSYKHRACGTQLEIRLESVELKSVA